MPHTIHVAHSPDSDDAFMFYALSEGKIQTGELEYVHELCDIESLNQRSRRGELEVSAVSIHAYSYIADRYALLASGSSMGDGYGPRLVATTAPPDDVIAALRGLRVGLPGKLTTAYLVLKMFQPDIEEVFLPFDAIEEAVLDGEVDVGLVIHEGQLTYAERGLHLWGDLGEWWQADTGLPLPLGGNVVRRDLGDDVVKQIAQDLKASIEYGLHHRPDALNHASKYNRGISDSQTDAFVGMYVNHWTVDYGERGREAVTTLLDRAHQAGLIPNRVDVEFVG
jgi:1,4-dihydroxy-6-naphthoate synthase